MTASKSKPKLNREHQDFHAGLKAFIARDKKLLILQDNEGLWELPGGRVEKEETYKDLKEVLQREIGEELGREFKCEIGSVFYTWIRKPNPDTEFHIFLAGFKCRFLNGDITLSPEHQEFRWISKGEVGKINFENTYKEAVRYYFKNI